MKKKTSWFTPYILNPHNINKVVENGKPGMFMVGNVNPDKKLSIKHIKSSGDVRTELKKYIGKFQIFIYKPLKFQLEAFKAQQQTLQLA